MFYLKKGLPLWAQWLCLAAPFGLGLTGALTGQWWLFAAAAVLVYATVALVRICRRRETVWVFLLLGPVALCFSSRLVYAGVELGFFEVYLPVVGLLFAAEFFGILFCLIELLGCLISHCIWRKQKPLRICSMDTERS
jgi:hypothetical protein